MTKRLSDKAFAKLAPEHAANCQNCDWQGHTDDLDIVRDQWERWCEGDTMWAGDCPECGAAAFTVAEIERQEAPRKAAHAMLAALKALAKIDTHTNALDSRHTWQAALAAIAQAEQAGITAEG